MRFADPYLLALLLLIPLILLARRRLASESSPGVFSNLSLLSGYTKTWRVRYRWFPATLRVLAVVMLIVALARPQSGRAATELPGEGIDIALVLDTSSSMTASFGSDTRMVGAKNVLTDFIQGRSDDRLGLVIFRERSLVLSPLTLDYDALSLLVESVEDVNLSDGTAIGNGLADGLNLLRESRARSRVVILATDGQNNSGEIEPGQAARIAEALGIRVYTIGLVDRQPGRGTFGSNVDVQALTEMAKVTGGQYFSADDEDSLQAIYDNIDQLETSAVGRPQYLAYDEIAPWFLGAALFFLFIELTVRATVWRQAS